MIVVLRLVRQNNVERIERISIKHVGDTPVIIVPTGFIIDNLPSWRNWIAQLISTQWVGGSSPSEGVYGDCSSVGRAADCGSAGRGFDPRQSPSLT